MHLLSRFFPGPTFQGPLPVPVARHREVAKKPARNLTVEEAQYVVFDTELTGLDFSRDSILSIGAVKMAGGRLFPTRNFYRLTRPDTTLKNEGVVVHEITHDDLKTAEDLSVVLPDFLEFVGEAILVGHFVHIDTHFISREMKRIFGISLRSPSVDTAALHDWLRDNDRDFHRHYGGVSSKTDLFSLAKAYGIENTTAHHALADALITAQLFQRFLPFLKKSGIRTARELIALR